MIMNPHVALFFVEMPSELTGEQERNLPSLVAELQSIAKRNAAVETLNAYTLLLRLNNALTLLTQVCLVAAREGFGSKVLFLASDHEWFHHSATNLPPAKTATAAP